MITFLKSRPDLFGKGEDFRSDEYHKLSRDRQKRYEREFLTLGAKDILGRIDAGDISLIEWNDNHGQGSVRFHAEPSAGKIWP